MINKVLDKLARGVNPELIEVANLVSRLQELEEEVTSLKGNTATPYIVTFENEVHQQWSCGILFSDFDQAKEYLLKKGFSEKNRLFERKDYNWSKFVKAYIEPLKVFNS